MDPFFVEIIQTRCAVCVLSGNDKNLHIRVILIFKGLWLIHRFRDGFTKSRVFAKGGIFGFDLANAVNSGRLDFLRPIRDGILSVKFVVKNWLGFDGFEVFDVDVVAVFGR